MRRDKNTIYETLFDVRPNSLRENFEKCMADCLECGFFFFERKGGMRDVMVCMSREKNASCFNSSFSYIPL